MTGTVRARFRLAAGGEPVEMRDGVVGRELRQHEHPRAVAQGGVLAVMIQLTRDRSNGIR